MKFDTRETISYKRAKLQTEGQRDKMNLPSSTKINDSSMHNAAQPRLEYRSRASMKNSLFHNYSKEFPALPTSSAAKPPILIDLTDEIDETKCKSKITITLTTFTEHDCG